MNVYAPPANFSEIEKDCFSLMVESTVTEIPGSEQLIVCGDWNGNIGPLFTGLKNVHGGQAIRKWNT